MPRKNDMNKFSKEEDAICSHVSYEINNDLEKLLRPYQILFKKLYKKALKVEEDAIYKEYSLYKGTEPIQIMARIVFQLNRRFPNGLEMCPLEDFFMGDLVNRSRLHQQQNGKTIWEFLLLLGKNLDEARTYVQFINNDLNVAEDAKNKNENNKCSFNELIER